MLARIIAYGKSPGEKKIDKCAKKVGATSIVRISRENRAGYSVFSIG
jgi:hypothetical protein